MAALPLEQVAPPRRTSGRRRSSALERRLVLVVTAAAAVGGGVSGAEPAGWLPADVFWSAGFAAVVTYAAARARRWAVVVLTAASAVAASGVLLVVGGAAVVVALAAAVSRRRSRLVGAIAGGLAVQVLLRLDVERTGLSALIAAAAVLPVFFSGYQMLRSGERRVVRRVLFGTAALAVVAAIGLGVAAVLTRSVVVGAGDDVKGGLEAVRANEPDQAFALLQAASAGFEDAHGTVSTFGLLARAFPVIGPQANALEMLTAEGAPLSETAAEATALADTDELRFNDGKIELETVAGFEEPLERAAEALAVADQRLTDADSPWLVDPLASGFHDFSDEVADARPDADLAIAGVRLAPALLGGEGTRVYFVAFTQPAEARGIGGFMGNFGELTVTDGDLEFSRSGRSSELTDFPGAEQRTIDGPPGYVARYGRFHPERLTGDMPFSPDGPSDAEVMEQVYPQAGGQPVDGVIIVDPVALAALMQFTGPIQVPGLEMPLTADNAADFLMRDQYVTFDQNQAGRIDFLDDAGRLTFEKLTQGDIPGPRQVSETLGPVADEGRLIAHSVHPEEQALFERIGVDGALPPVDGDFVSVVTQNNGNNKIDVFLHRTIDYRARWNPDTGRVAATATVALRNDAPSSGLPDYVIGSPRDLPIGTNRVFFSFYTPWLLEEATINGLPLPMESQEELGRRVFSAFFNIPSGATVTVELELAGALPPGTTYRLGYAPQPLVNPDDATLQVTPRQPWNLAEVDGFADDDRSAAVTVESGEDLELVARVRR